MYITENNKEDLRHTHLKLTENARNVPTLGVRIGWTLKERAKFAVETLYSLLGGNNQGLTFLNTERSLLLDRASGQNHVEGRNSFFLFFFLGNRDTLKCKEPCFFRTTGSRAV